MTRKWKIIVALLIALPLLAGATGVKAVVNVFTDDLKMPDYSPCRSAAQAKQRGTWVCDVTATPTRLTWQGHNIAFREAWVEEAAAPAHFLVWFPHYQRAGNEYLCFNLAEGQELFPAPRIDPPLPFFRLEGESSGFPIHWPFDPNERPGTFCNQSDTTHSFPVKMGIATAPRDPVDAYEITLTVKPKEGLFR
jgi:hypothetical protein